MNNKWKHAFYETRGTIAVSTDVWFDTWTSAFKTEPYAKRRAPPPACRGPQASASQREGSDHCKEFRKDTLDQRPTVSDLQWDKKNKHGEKKSSALLVFRVCVDINGQIPKL